MTALETRRRGSPMRRGITARRRTQLRGTPARPLSEAEMSGKFRSCAVRVLGADAAEKADSAAQKIESFADIGEMMRLFQAALN